MTVDSHTHIFKNWLGACGHPSREIHWKYIQKILMGSAAQVYRARDGALSDKKYLLQVGDNTWNGLCDDVNFRVGIHGQMEFTVNGENYYVQYFPVDMSQIESTAELLLAQMNVASVNHCVLQAGLCYGIMNDYNALVQQRYPERFTGLFHIDSAIACTQESMKTIELAYHKLELRGLYYSLEDFSRYGFAWNFDDVRFDPFWELIASFNIPVFFEAPAIPNYDKASYVANMKRLDGILTRFPHMRWLLVMGPPALYFAKNGKWEFPKEIEKTYYRENLQFEIIFPITWGGVWDYPFHKAQALIRDLRDKYGAQKLIWGSDLPNVERFCTYKQSLDYVLRYCEFLTSYEKDQILGENLIDLCKIKL